ncbi:MAG: IS21 family transposase [Pseudonocardiales bacterium]|nr:IS21 family transposase [Pseudonocardiales bacterium]
MIDVVEILQHWHAGRSKLVLSASLGVDVKTVRKYVAPAEAVGITPGDGLVLDRVGWAARVAEWFPELSDARARSSTWPALEAHRDLIKSMIETNTVATAHQRLRDEHDVRVSVTSLRRYVWQAFPDRNGGREPTVLRPAVPPGQEAQIDYGYLGRWCDPLGDRVRRVWAFVVVLACSRHMFVRPVLGMNQTSWVAAHVAAWEFFGGVPTRLVSDNLKTGVIKPDLYDPKLNRAYAEMAAHYGALIDPARAKKPKDKPCVERMMPYVRDSYWRGRTFASVADMQARAVEWALGVAGTRSHRSLDGVAPLALFQAVEAPALLGLPGAPFELARWLSPRVAPDCHVSVDKVLYSVPWRFIGVQVDARVTDRVVQIFAAGELIKTWPRSERGRCTDNTDYPPEKIAFFMRTPVWCRNRAAELGPGVAELVAGLLAEPVLHRLRAAQGVLALADKHGSERLDAACTRALAVGDPSYRTVKGILAAGAETATAEVPGGTTASVVTPAHLHGPDGLLAHLAADPRTDDDGQVSA